MLEGVQFKKQKLDGASFEEKKASPSCCWSPGREGGWKELGTEVSRGDWEDLRQGRDMVQLAFRGSLRL